MKIVSEIRTKQDLEELKSAMEIYLVSYRAKELAQSA
jgi:hypothetical protein